MEGFSAQVISRYTCSEGRIRIRILLTHDLCGSGDGEDDGGGDVFASQRSNATLGSQFGLPDLGVAELLEQISGEHSPVQSRSRGCLAS